MAEDRRPYSEGIQSTRQAPDITAIVRVLESKRDEAVRDKSEVESRWIRDLQQVEGNTSDRLTKGAENFQTALRKTPPIVHITRTRTMSIAARIINMLVPSNERSWDITPTPVPSLVRGIEDDSPVIDPATGETAMVPDLNDDGTPAAGMTLPASSPSPADQSVANPAAGGQPIPGMPPAQPGIPERPVLQSDLARMQMKEAEKKCRRMREHMDDQLTECRFNAEQRKVIVDGCKLGIGVMEGPGIVGAYRKRRKQVEGGIWQTEVIEEPAPEFRAVDPWTFYPLPCESIEQCEGVFTVRLMTRWEIQGLKELPGFDTDMIDEVLAEEPHFSEAYNSTLIQRQSLSGETLNTANRYSVWRYVGTLNRQDQLDIGIDVDQKRSIDPMIESWFVNTRMIKAKPFHMENAVRVPYYVWNYEKAEASIWGYGVPYLMRDSDRSMQSTWHMMLHNAAMSAGPQLIRKKGVVEPADGDENIGGGMKQWYLKDVETPVSDAFHLFQIECRIDQLADIHDRSRQNADEELSFPLIMQGEPTEAVPTSSGLAMLMNAANVTPRRIAQSYDDDILEPSITALYEYNMDYLDDPEAKGDMQVRPFGATKLVVKDMQAQHLMAIANITTNDRFAPYMNDKNLVEGILKAADADVATYMKTQEELDNQGPSEAETAELEYKKAQTRKLNAEADALGGQGEDGQARWMAELQRDYDHMEMEIRLAEIKRDTAALQAAAQENVSMAEISAKFELGTRSEENKRFLGEIKERREAVTAGYTARLKAEEVNMKKQNLNKGFDTYG